MLPRKYGLYDEIIDSAKKIGSLLLPNVVAEEVSESCQAPLAPKVLLVLLLALHKLGVLLVYAVVCQMLETFVFTVGCTLVVYLGCEPAQSFLINKYSERVNSSDGHVNSEVELEAVDQERIVDVVADNQRRVLFQFAVHH